MPNELVGIVEEAADVRGDPKVPRDYVVDAVERVESGKEEVQRFESGFPSPQDIYDLAARLYDKATNKSK